MTRLIDRRSLARSVFILPAVPHVKQVADEIAADSACPRCWGMDDAPNAAARRSTWGLAPATFNLFYSFLAGLLSLRRLYGFAL